MALEKLFQLMAEKNASDLFISVGSPVTIKINGVCVPVNQERLTPEQVIGLLAERLTDAHFSELEEDRELNLGLPVQGLGSFRLSAFLQRGTASAVIRFIPHDVPRLDSLTLPEMLKDVVLERRGLVLVVGAAGSGKSTTIASMLDHRNELMSGIKRAVIMADGPQISADDLGLQAAHATEEPINLRKVREEAEYKALVKALARVDGNVVKAAELLGMSRPTIYDLMSRHGIK